MNSIFITSTTEYINNENFRRKSFGGKTSAEKVSDKFFNFGGKSFGQSFLSRKTFEQGFCIEFTQFTQFWINIKGS